MIAPSEVRRSRGWCTACQDATGLPDLVRFYERMGVRGCGRDALSEPVTGRRG